MHTVSAYLDDPAIGFILKMCRLKPYDMLLRCDHRYELKLHRHWIDEYGTSLRIIKKRIKIVPNDLTVDRKVLRCSDIYDGLSMKQTATISKAVRATKKDDRMIGLLGLDDYLRAFIRLNGQWHRCSSLLFDMQTLKQIALNKDIGYTITVDNGWLMKWPTSKELIDDCGARDYLLREIMDE